MLLRGIKQTAAGTAPRDFHPRVVLTRPYLLPATLLTLGLGNPGKNGASFSYKGVSLSLPPLFKSCLALGPVVLALS